MHLLSLKRRFLSYSVLLILLSCSNGETRKPVEDSYVTSGVEQFFLPELPTWANYSLPGRCFKSSSFQYLDFAKIKANYQLEYPQLIELQGQYNERREAYFASTAYRFLKPVEEASFFSNTIEQVRGGVKHFQIPPAQSVSIIWLEAYLQHGKVEELKKLTQSERFNESVPVLFSSCYSRSRLNQWIQEAGLADVGLYLLSAEWLSPYGSDVVLQPGLRLDVRKLLNPGVKVQFVVPDNTIAPLELTL